MNKITVIGSANVDLIMKMKSLPRPGETLTGGVFSQAFGGKGANQAVSAARSASKETTVSFVACLGNDGYADSILESFTEDGLNVKYVSKIEDVSTGTAVILVDDNATNSIAVAPGANFRLMPEHIDAAISEIKDSEYILLQMEIPVKTTEYIIETASKLSKKVILNVAPAILLKDEFLGKVSILIVNETEASVLSNTQVETEAEIKAAAKILQSKGIETVIITLGDKGSYALSQSISAFVPAYKVKAIDTTAAGDTYCGALAVALCDGKSLVDAIKFASAASAISVTRMGAQPSVPTRNEIEQLLNL